MAIKRLFAIAFLLIANTPVIAESLRVAVTASFRPVLEEMIPLFEKKTGHSVSISSASTGTLYQQSLRGAPFDIFLSADIQRPKSLQHNLNLPETTVFLYAQGDLVFVSTDATIERLADIHTLNQPVIIANADVAPFGIAAEQVLSAIGYSGKKVLANNVMQAQQYLNLGLSPIGIVSASVALNLPNKKISPSYYDPVVQAGILLNSTPTSLAFVEFIKSPEVLELYQKFGYSMPNNND